MMLHSKPVFILLTPLACLALHPVFACLIFGPQDLAGECDPVAANGSVAEAAKLLNESTPGHEESWYLQTGDRKCFLFIREIGQGEPVVVIHGGPGGGHNSMVDLCQGLVQKHRFVFYDQRGAGLSFADKEDISMAKHVEDIESIRLALGEDKLTLISHSAGTYSAMEYLRTHPDRVAGVVLLGAVEPMNGDPGFFTPEESADHTKTGDQMKQFANRKALDEERKKAGLDGSELTPRQQFHLRKLRMAAANIFFLDRWRQVRFNFINQTAATQTFSDFDFVYDWSQILESHHYPVTVINGEYDVVVGPRGGSKVWQRLADANDTVQFRVVPEAGHLLWIDQPDPFRKLLSTALDAEPAEQKNGPARQ